MTTGLEGVVFARSAISDVDGARGELRYRGYLVDDLCRRIRYEDVCWLLWHGELPTADESAALRDALAAERSLPAATQAIVLALAEHRGADAMAALRTAVSSLAVDDVTGDVADPRANLARAVRVTARVPLLIAAFDRARKGLPPVAARRDLSQAACFLHALTGRVPSDDEAAVLDACLTIHAENGLNPSTFTARCTISTLSDLWSGVTSMLATLAGPWHGGANTAVMRALLEIGSAEAVPDWLDRALADRRRVMGFGHPIYLAGDPRARILRDLSRRMAELRGEPRWFEITRALADEMAARRKLFPNLDLWSASTYYYLGIDPDLFTCVFAMARMPGLTAHLIEQYAANRLIRPQAQYAGPGPRELP